jgi:hypothetical protein
VSERSERCPSAANGICVWFPLEVPKNCDRQEMTAAVVAQVRRITAVAFLPARSEE